MSPAAHRDTSRMDDPICRAMASSVQPDARSCATAGCGSCEGGLTRRGCMGDASLRGVRSNVAGKGVGCQGASEEHDST